MPAISDEQSKLLQELRATDANSAHDWDDLRGVARFVRGRLTVAPLTAGKVDPGTLETVVARLLERYGVVFGPSDLAQTIRLLRTRIDDLGFHHLEYQQVYRRTVVRRRPIELDVFGSKLIAHFDSVGVLVEVQSSCWSSVSVGDDSKLTVSDLRKAQVIDISRLRGFQELDAQMRERKEQLFPLMQEPQLVVYPWENGFRLAWTSFSFGSIPEEDPGFRQTGRRIIAFGFLVTDAASGERLVFTRTQAHVDIPDTGTGLGVTPLGGPFTVRNLNIIRVDATNTYQLRDTTHSRDIIVFNAQCNSLWVYPNVESLIANGTIPRSSDTDGDKNWNAVAATTTTAARQASQQPEVDSSYWVGQVFDWYDAIAGGRAGWDDNQYPNPPVPPQVINVVSHGYDTSAGSCRSVNAYHDIQLVSGNWVSMLEFFDGNPTQTCTTANDRAFDFLSGSALVVAHEYTHGITNYSFINGNNPGLPYPQNPSPEWLSAIHEGMSDVMGGLFSGSWLIGQDISTSGTYLRNLAFPRDPNSWENQTGTFPCGLGFGDMDHFADRNLLNFRYSRGTILAHCAYLTGQGGVHQRTSRSPVLIPVRSLGLETRGGKQIRKAARIFYRGLTHYLGNIGATTGIPTNDETVFRTLRNGCVSAAIDIYGYGSFEHLTTVLAWYAVGLQPTGTSYGADVTFLTWGADWWMSRPYVGIPSPDWSSVDLFINNGGTSDWNALINVIDASGNPTQFENIVYCRVRNVGDQPAQNVQVQFFYAKAGTSVVTWTPVTDKAGSIQTLNVGTLAAGVSNFPDSQQNSPPSSASVKWYIPPLGPGETVDHFCLKATAFSLNDVNPTNNEVQSNVAYAPYTPGSPLRIGFYVGNREKKAIGLNVEVRANLPEGWLARILEPTHGIELRPGEERPLTLEVNAGHGAEVKLEPPFDGVVNGQVYGTVSGPFTGALTSVRQMGDRISGELVVNLTEVGSVFGRFDGAVNAATAEIEGRLIGALTCEGTPRSQPACLRVVGCLQPLRHVSVAQLVEGNAVGGVTVQVQVPAPGQKCKYELAPTATRVRPDGSIPGEPERAPEPEPEPEAPRYFRRMSGKLLRLVYDCHGDFHSFALDTCDGEVVFEARDSAIERVLQDAWRHHATVTVRVKPDSRHQVSWIDVSN